MRLIKTVAREFFHQVKNGFRKIAFDVSLNRPFGKQDPLLSHLVWVFLAHSLAQNIGAAERVVAEHLRNLHHLLLIEDDPVSIREHRLQFWVRV